MLQIKKLNLTHKKDLRVILDDFNLVLNDGDKAVIIGEEGNGKSTLIKVQLMRLFICDVSVLLLDEPSNDIDIATLTLLEKP